MLVGDDEVGAACSRSRRRDSSTSSTVRIHPTQRELAGRDALLEQRGSIACV